jgi:hypothetical protein
MANTKAPEPLQKRRFERSIVSPSRGARGQALSKNMSGSAPPIAQNKEPNSRSAIPRAFHPGADSATSSEDKFRQPLARPLFHTHAFPVPFRQTNIRMRAGETLMQPESMKSEPAIPGISKG